MERTVTEDRKKRYAKRRILPLNVTYRSKQGDYMWRKTYKGVPYGPVYDNDLDSLIKRIPRLEADIYNGAVKRLETQGWTLNALFDAMMEEKVNIREATRVNQYKYWSWYIRGSIGNKLIKDISREELRDKYKRLISPKEENLGFNTLKLIHGLISGAYEWGVDNDKIEKNAAKNIMKTIQMPEEATKGERDLTEKEERIFFGYVDNHKYFKYHSDLFYIMKDLGLRAGEAIGLCISDIDFSDETISIRRTLNYRDNVGDGSKRKFFTNTKSLSSRRTLPFICDVGKRIEEHMEKQKLAEITSVEEIDGRKDLIFLTQRGTAYTVDYLNLLIHRIVKSYNRQEMKKARKEEREPIYLEDFSSHAFRHTFGQRLKDKGVKDNFIMDWMGHASLKTTKIYAKPGPKSLRRTMPEFLKTA